MENLGIYLLPIVVAVSWFLIGRGLIRHFKKPLRTRESNKINLIKNLAKKRFQNDPIAQEISVMEYIDSLPDTELMGLPEATIVTIVETYSQLGNQGLSDKEIFEVIENHRAIIGAGTIPSPLTLSTYIKYRVGLEHSGIAPISETFIDEAIKEATAHYKGDR